MMMMMIIIISFKLEIFAAIVKEKPVLSKMKLFVNIITVFPLTAAGPQISVAPLGIYIEISASL